MWGNHAFALRPASLALTLSGALVVAGCTTKSSGGSGPGASFDAGDFDVTFGDDTGVDAGVPHDAMTADAVEETAPAACLLDAGGGTCNALTAVNTTVTGTCSDGGQPVGTGGTVVDGTYVMTAREGTNAGCTTATFQATMVVEGSCANRVDVLGNVPDHRNHTFETSGNTLTRTATCGTQLPAATYTATSTQLVIFDQGGAITTWTRQ